MCLQGSENKFLSSYTHKDFNSQQTGFLNLKKVLNEMEK